ncbi:MAG: glycosyltransferase [Gaiellales bacterium]
MRALAFGTYDAEYPRNAQVISCLRAVGVVVLERNEPVWRRHNWAIGPRDLVRLALAERRLARDPAPDADVILVGYPGHFDLRAARQVAAGRPIVFNPLVSLYDTIVGDRARLRPGDPRARLLRRLDRRAFRSADLVVADTEAHATFFREAFDLDPGSVAVAYVGAEDRLFSPGTPVPDPFHALFVGKLVPLHGLETILAAARIASDIRFTIVGEGQLTGLLGSLPPNVEHRSWIPYEQLPDLYRRAGCALGIFGKGDKAARVIPNKAFQAIACGRPLVTADTRAARELLTGGVDAILVPPGDPEALATAVRGLADDANLRERIGRAGRDTYLAHASERVLGETWRELLERVVGR